MFSLQALLSMWAKDVENSCMEPKAIVMVSAVEWKVRELQLRFPKTHCSICTWCGLWLLCERREGR